MCKKLKKTWICYMCKKKFRESKTFKDSDNFVVCPRCGEYVEPI